MQDRLKNELLRLTKEARKRKPAIDPAGEYYFTPYRVASQLYVSEKTVWKWIRTGRLRACRLGRRYRIPESGLREFLESSQTVPRDLGNCA